MKKKGYDYAAAHLEADKKYPWFKTWEKENPGIRP
jgi:hypothetical protein